MPINSIYRSEVQYFGSWRYVIEIIPASTTLLSTPDIVEFKSAAIIEWDFDTRMNPDVVGMKDPNGFKIRLDLELLPDDLKDYILNPFVNHNIADEFPFKRDTRQDIPNFDLTNVWHFKTDEGDSEAEVDDFEILNTFGMKKNPSIKHEITKTDEISKHKIDIILHDIVRIIDEAIHPIYFTWLAIDDVLNNTRYTPKTVQRVYDFVYSDHGDNNEFYECKVKVVTDTDPLTSTTVDGVALSVGDLVVWERADGFGITVHELIDVVPTYSTVNTYNQYNYDAKQYFSITHGANAGKVFNFLITPIAADFGYGNYITLTEFTANTSITRIIAKVDGNVNGVAAHYLVENAIEAYHKLVFDFFYKRLLRVDQTNTEYVITITGSITQAFNSKYKQQSRNYENYGSATPYFCALVENAGVFVDGFLAENDDDFGLYEYENIWDFYQNIKGMGLFVSYYHNDKNIKMKYSAIKGDIDGIFDTLELSDIVLGNGAKFTVNTNSNTKRGVVVSINVQGDNKNEHKYITNGSISESELNVKSIFHNNPSVNVAEDGWIETNQYPELKSSLIRHVKKQNDPERPFDAHKLVYFDTPTDIADSEMAIRLHSATTTWISSETTDYHVMPFDLLPISAEPFDALKVVAIDLQRYAGMPFAMARSLTTQFGANGKPDIEIKVPIELIIKKPAGQRLVLNISSKLTNIDGLDFSIYWLINEMKYNHKDNYATVKLITYNL